jgi:adenylylsulfate kinase-like enzyme
LRNEAKFGQDLGFTDADRIEYVRRVAEVARPMVG